MSHICSKLLMDDLEKSMNKIFNFLITYLPLANAQASEFITRQLWEKQIPGNVRQELTFFTDDQLKTLPICGYPGESLKLETNGQVKTHSHAFEFDSKRDSEIKYDLKIKDDFVRSPEKTYIFDKDNDINFEIENEATVAVKNDPEKLFREINSVTLQPDCNSLRTEICDFKVCQLVNWKHDCLQKFCNDAQSNTIDGLGLAVSVAELFGQLKVAEDVGSDVFVSSFMNHKKSHEVNIMGEVCAQLSKCTGCKLVVDIGSGKGYLGQTLFLQHKMAVLGIDALSSNTSAADKRLGIMGKQWKGLTRNLQNEQNGVKLTKKQKKQLKSKDESQKNNELVGTEEKKLNIAQADTCNDVDQFPCCQETNKNCKFSDSSMLTASNTELGCYIPLTMYVDTETDLKALAMEIFPLISSNKDKPYLESNLNDSLIHVETSKTHFALSSRNSNRHITQISRQSESSSIMPNDSSSSKQQESIHQLVGSVKSSKNYMASDSVVCSKQERSLDETQILLTGLHTCGNLACSILELFVANNDIKSVCSVGCCYHLLTERFLSEAATQGIDKVQYGFPMSSFLKKKRVCLGNTARNLASQSVHKIAESDELQGYRFFPRALLQKMIEDLVSPESVKWTGLRKLEQRSSGVSDYIRKAWKKLCLPEDIVSEDLIQEYIERYQEKKQQLGAFFQLKAILAPCIESLILLDRAYFLLEQENIKDVYLVRMFDPYVSPRCYSIVAAKR